MKLNWDPSLWKRSTKLLLGVVTAWPYLYLIFFIVGVFSLTFFLSPNRGVGYCGTIDIVQLERKIKNGELKEMVVKPTEILARSRSGTCEYRVAVSDERSREEILQKARQVDASGAPLVPKVIEESVSPFAVAGFIAVFVVHMLTILLVLGLLAIYIVLAINNPQLDQAKRITWIVLLAMLTMLSMPVYWYLYVWRTPPPQQGESLATS